MLPTVEDRRYVTALARGLQVLQCFRWGEKWLPHQEITRRTRLPKATVSRLAFTLQALGYLEHDAARGAYALGPGGLALGFRVLANAEIATLARPVLEELAAHTQAAVSIGVRHQLSMVYIAHARGLARLTLSLDVGARIPVERTAMGRALVCAMPPEQRAAVHAKLEEKLGPRWAAAREGLERAEAQYAASGFVTSLGEWEPDVSAVGTVISPGPHREPYAITIGGPSSVLTPTRLLQEFGPRLVQDARRIERVLRFERESAA